MQGSGPIVKVIAPQLPALLHDLSDIRLEDEADIEACRLSGADLGGIGARSISLEEVVFEKVSLTGAKLERFNVRDGIFKQCDLSATRCPESAWQRVVMVAGRMTGWDMSDGLCKDVVFENCKLDLTNFRFAKLNRVRFVDCILHGADFSGATLREVGFERCNLNDVNFRQASLQKVDLRTSELIGLSGWAYMKGARIDDIQLQTIAPYLAQEIGLRVVS